jgi:o-succinylbenzoate synthase
MKILKVRTYRLSLPMHTTFVTALRTTKSVETLVVELITDTGLHGFGEASQVWQVTGESVVGVQACVEGPLFAQLVGRDPEDILAILRDVRRAVAGNTSAKAAVDVALHDLVARIRNVPLVRLLGGTTMVVPTDVTLPVGPADELVTAAEDRVADGFTALKIKVSGDPRQAVETVLAIRGAVGPSVLLRLDANQAWNDREAVRVITALENGGADIEMVEQPVPAHDLDGLERVTSRVNTPIMADESVYGIEDLLALIRRQAVDLVNVKLAKSGGLSVAGTLLELARAAGIGTIVGSMMESPIGVAAAASLAAAHGTSAISDLDAAWWLEDDSRFMLTYEGGQLILPDRPGLGIESINDLVSAA